MKGFSSKPLHFTQEMFPIYRPKERKTLLLFPELFPFGGKLNESNRWLKIAELIPWEELEEEYARHFSDIGRSATAVQLAIYRNDVGLLNDVREWPVRNIKRVGKAIGKKYRIYTRKSRKDYLNFSKKKRRTKKMIRKAKRKMLQYVGRNIRQLKDGIEQVKAMDRGLEKTYKIAYK